MVVLATQRFYTLSGRILSLNKAKHIADISLKGWFYVAERPRQEIHCFSVPRICETINTS